jgi:hypothetical protein
VSAKTTIEGAVEVTHCDTAKEFLDFLQINDRRWLPDNATSSPWIFRGQRCADWPLLPKALRDDCDWFDEFKERERSNVKMRVNVYLGQERYAYHPDEYQPNRDVLCEMALQVAAEWNAVEEFVYLADRVGHVIPENESTWALGDFSIADTVRDLLSDYGTRPQLKYKWLGPSYVVFALAQHHGVPTKYNHRGRLG